MERRVNRLENQLRLLQERGQATSEGHISEEGDAADSSAQAVKALLAIDNEKVLNAPWLFSCQVGTPTSALQVLLEFDPSVTEELNLRQWKREEDMWITFIEELPEDLRETRPDSLSLDDLRKAARRALLSLCKGELLLILRSVPGKKEANVNPLGITLVAIMAAALSEAWQRAESADPDSLGRIAMVLEGDGIGRRLRAGNKRFSIEALN